MQGPTHAISGTVGGLAVSEIPGLCGAPLTVPQQLTIAGLVTGAALLPDLDLPKSTIAATGGLSTRVHAAGVPPAQGRLVCGP